MTLSERVYRWLLLAYPAEFRREYGESMAQLFRDQMRDCRTTGRRALLWIRILADTARAAPAAQLEAVTRPGGWLMKSRTALAMLASLLLLEAGSQVVAFNYSLFWRPFKPLFSADPSIYPLWQRICFDVAHSVIDALPVAVALMPLLIVAHKLSLGRTARAAAVALVTVWATMLVSENVVALWFLGSRNPVFGWLMSLSVVATFVLLIAKLNVGKAARCVFAAVPVATLLLGGLFSRRVFQLPQLITHSVGDSLFLLLCAAGFMLLLKKLGIGSPARAFLASVPVLAASPIAFATYDQLVYLRTYPTSAVLYFAHAFLLPICLAAAAWAAGAGEGSQEEPESNGVQVPA